MSGLYNAYSTQHFTLSIGPEYIDELQSSTTIKVGKAIQLDFSQPSATHDVFTSMSFPSDGLRDHLQAQLKIPSQLLQNNEAVAFPTETVYGLGANAHSDEAIQKIYQAKGRPSDNPLIVHVSTADQLLSIVKQPFTPLLLLLAQRFWPGPLTIIVPHNSHVSPLVTAGLDTVGIRIPSHPIALALISESNLPLAAPSANTSGKPSPTKCSHVLHDLTTRIAGVVDGIVAVNHPASDLANNQPTCSHVSLDCLYGVESTVIDISHLDPTLTLEQLQHEDNQPGQDNHILIHILRPGAITKDMLETAVGVGRVQYDPTLLLDVSTSYEKFTRSVVMDPQAQPVVGVEASSTVVSTSTDSNPTTGSTKDLPDDYLQPKSPGMKYTHYAPTAPVYIGSTPSQLFSLLTHAIHHKSSVGIGTDSQPAVDTHHHDSVRTAIDSVDPQHYQHHIGLMCAFETLGEIADLFRASYPQIVLEQSDLQRYRDAYSSDTMPVVPPHLSLERQGILDTIAYLSCIFNALVQQHTSSGDNTSQLIVKPVGSVQDVNTISMSLYSILREFDEPVTPYLKRLGMAVTDDPSEHDYVSIICADIVSNTDTSISTAIVNRMLKACGGRVLMEKPL